MCVTDPVVSQLRADLHQNQPHLQPGLQGRTQHASQALQGPGAEVSQSVPGPAGEHVASSWPAELRARTPCGSARLWGLRGSQLCVYCVQLCHACVSRAPARVPLRTPLCPGALLTGCGHPDLGGCWLQSLRAPGRRPGWAGRTCPSLPASLPSGGASRVPTTQGREGLHGDLTGGTVAAHPWASLHLRG